MTSPSRKPARAPPSVAASTLTPPLILSSFFCASPSSLTLSPSSCTAALGRAFSSRSAGLRVATFSGSDSPMTTLSSLLAPRRNTVKAVRVPGLTLPTKRGRSDAFSTVLPSKRVMMSPASTPAFSAGDPLSTPRTSAPWALPSPSDSAMSLVTWSICTPMRPRVTRPVARNWSLTRTASSIGIANAMPM